MTPKRPNESGESPCLCRWIVETPAGWLGAWDVEAFDAYAAGRMEGQQDLLAFLQDIAPSLGPEQQAECLRLLGLRGITVVG